MGSRPEDAPAGRAAGEFAGRLEDERGNELRRLLPGDLLQGDIAFQAAAVGTNGIPEAEIVHDLPDLIFPLFALDEEKGQAFGSLEERPVAGEEGPPFAPGKGKEVVVLGPG